MSQLCQNHVKNSELIVWKMQPKSQHRRLKTNLEYDTGILRIPLKQQIMVHCRNFNNEGIISILLVTFPMWGGVKGIVLCSKCAILTLHTLCS